MRTASLLLAFALLPGSASPQTSQGQARDASPSAQPSDTQVTAAAIEAIVRGDYARAAELLEPLERLRSGTIDPAAAFFLAALYEDGLGVPQDEVRACALRLRSHTDASGPFGRLGYALARAKMTELGLHWSRECEMLSHLGSNHGFTPARFALDLDHWVAIDLSGEKQDLVATVSYRNREKNVALMGLPKGAVFLPIEYTKLGGGVDGSKPRHFVELAMWVPGEAVSSWSLLWSLGEIVDRDVVAVRTDTLTTVESDAPPADILLQLRELVALRINDAGHAEFEILNGPNATREGIPSSTERRELAEEIAKRKAADEKINWKRRRDPGRTPTFDYVDADGCQDLFVYGWSAGRADAIAIRVDRQLLELTTAPRTFDLGIPQAEIEVVAEVFERPQRQFPFCTDVRDGSVRHETWRAVGGTISVQLSAPGIRAQDPNQYRATIQIDNAEFMSTTGAVVRSPGTIRLTAVAGSSGG
jgi:hypothetical protein